METFKDIIEWAGYLLAFIGFLATVYKTNQVLLSLKTFSWGDVDKNSKVIIKKIACDNYMPDVIVGIGRGGSILGAIISGNLPIPNRKARNIPILGVDRLYEWQNGARIETENKMIDFSPLEGQKILLVAGDVLTGGTMKFYVNQLEQANVAKIKSACLVKGVITTFQPDYFGKEIPGEFNMPWMYKGYKYVKDSRRSTNC